MSLRIASYTLACAMMIAPAASAQTPEPAPQPAPQQDPKPQSPQPAPTPTPQQPTPMPTPQQPTPQPAPQQPTPEPQPTPQPAPQQPMPQADRPLTAQLQAATDQRETTVQIASATRLPGITLQPGSYVFKLGTPSGKQNVVEVWSTDGSKKIGTFLTVDYAEPMVGTTATVLYPNSNPPTLRAWYFPGESVGRAFVYTEDEAVTLSTSAATPVFYASWNPDDNLPIGSVRVQTTGESATEQVADAAKAVGEATVDAAQAVGDKVEDVWDNATDNASLQNPTDARKAAERQLDAAEKTYDDLEDRLTEEQEAPLKAFRDHLEKLEDAFEKNDQTWMTHYTAAMAALDALAPERPVGTSGGAATLDVTTQAALGTIRAQLKAFHDVAMK